MFRPFSPYLGHAELEHAADVLLGRLHAAHVHLRERTEGAHASHRHLVAALDHRRHLALDRDAGLGRHRQRLPRLRALPELERETQLVPRRHDGGLDLVSDGDAQPPVLVAELGAVDPGLALAADVDEDAFGRDVDDAPLHHLADLQGPPGFFSGEQCGEILGR